MGVVSNPDTLGDLLLFRGLSHDQLAHLNEMLHRKTFPSGADIMTADQPGDVAYIIVSGTVKIYVDQADGSSVILAILGPGEIVGEMSILENSGRSANVVTLEESTLFWLHRDAFDACLQTMPALTYNLVRILSRRLRITSMQIQSLATLDVFGRVARQILAFAQEYGVPDPDGGTLIPLRLTQTDLAGLVGASRVRVNQVLVFYKERKYISVNRNYRITVLDSAALLQRCQ
jgi:CRP/FNR family cyclic AMP-dependent transcriptional regulator